MIDPRPRHESPFQRFTLHVAFANFHRGGLRLHWYLAISHNHFTISEITSFPNIIWFVDEILSPETVRILLSLNLTTSEIAKPLKKPPKPLVTSSELAIGPVIYATRRYSHVKEMFVDRTTDLLATGGPCRNRTCDHLILKIRCPMSLSFGHTPRVIVRRNRLIS